MTNGPDLSTLPGTPGKHEPTATVETLRHALVKPLMDFLTSSMSDGRRARLRESIEKTFTPEVLAEPEVPFALKEAAIVAIRDGKAAADAGVEYLQAKLGASEQFKASASLLLARLTSRL
jgi:hypothetical protein